MTDHYGIRPNVSQDDLGSVINGPDSISNPDRRMNCCHIVSAYYPGLPDPYEYTQKLAAAGLNVDVVARSRFGEPTNQRMGRVQVTRVANAYGQRRTSLAALSFVRPALRALHGHRYDLVHVYAFRGSFLLPILARRVASKWVFDLRTGSVSPSRLKQAFANRLTAAESDAFSARIALDKCVGERVFGSRRGFHVVPLGAEIEKFASGNGETIRKRCGWSDRTQIVVYTGSLAPQRRPLNILRAFAHAVESNNNLVLLIIGSQRPPESMQLAIDELGIDTKVFLLHDIPYAEIQDYVCAADIGFAYVPSSPQFYYQPPLKTAEFLAAGLPTVATDTHGNRQFIKHGENGLLAADDPIELGRAIAELATDQVVSNRIRAHAPSSVAAYDWTQIVQRQLLPVYRNLLATSPNSVAESRELAG